MNVSIKNLQLAQNLPFVLIAGPCQIENRDHAMKMAETLLEITSRVEVPFVFKSSFDKANRTSLGSARGVGMEAGLEILSEISASLNVPVITDIHEAAQASIVAEHVDILQIPAFLCRQTDLLQAAGQAGKVVMVKKGQFLAPEDMSHVAAKIAATGNKNILLCERGTSFGYHNLINDFRGLHLMAGTGYPVIFDATHSTQSLGGAGGVSGGAREFAPLLARAALAVGVAGLFVEVHDDPDQAPSDGPAMMTLEGFEEHLKAWKALDDLTKSTLVF